MVLMASPFAGSSQFLYRPSNVGNGRNRAEMAVNLRFGEGAIVRGAINSTCVGGYHG
jgi:hypothetical protein